MSPELIIVNKQFLFKIISNEISLAHRMKALRRISTFLDDDVMLCQSQNHARVLTSLIHLLLGQENTYTNKKCIEKHIDSFSHLECKWYGCMLCMLLGWRWLPHDVCGSIRFHSRVRIN